MPNGIPALLVCRCNSGKLNSHQLLHPQKLPLLLGGWETKQYDFHYFNGEAPPALRLHWENQQDAIRHTWKGHIVGTGGGVQWKEQRMGAGMYLDLIVLSDPGNWPGCPSWWTSIVITSGSSSSLPAPHDSSLVPHSHDSTAAGFNRQPHPTAHTGPLGAAKLPPRANRNHTL
jgi:hypothetical protein